MNRRRFKSFMRERSELSTRGDETLLSVSEYYGVKPRTHENDDSELVSRAESLEGYRLVVAGDFVMNYMLAWKGAYGVSDFDGIVSPAYAVFRIDERVANRRYLHHCLRSTHFHSIFRSASKGIIQSRLRLYPDAFLALSIDLPDIATQKAIADFLDRETARIDQLIEKKQQLIKLLGEKRNSSIHLALTKGLRSEAELVSTGIPWFSELPAHWNLKPLRHVVRFQRGHDLPDESRVDGGVPVVTSGGVTSLHNVAVARAPGLVTGRYGTIGTFYYVEQDYWPLNTTLYSRQTLEFPRYVWYLLQDMSHIFVLNSMKSAVPGVDRNDIHPERVPVPPLEEQLQLAEWLDQNEANFKHATVKIQRSIDQLRELRTALITSAVTGQLDISTWNKRGEPERQLESIEAVV